MTSLQFIGRDGIYKPHPIPASPEFHYEAPLSPAIFSRLFGSLPSVVEKAYEPEVLRGQDPCIDCGRPFDPEKFYFQPGRGRYLPRCRVCHKAKVKQDKATKKARLCDAN